ncbi:Hypothetical predicted protein [Octopus vulgaris]|uniref:Uncharacterized protein n=1 Tax=Octopus vulgaris TaxID=6645 RepID=A0AA36FAR9_OCTVU|nr:Hypothetical predicted protein [Octopus vulgaris]
MQSVIFVYQMSNRRNSNLIPFGEQEEHFGIDFHFLNGSLLSYFSFITDDNFGDNSSLIPVNNPIGNDIYVRMKHECSHSEKE